MATLAHLIALAPVPARAQADRGSVVDTEDEPSVTAADQTGVEASTGDRLELGASLAYGGSWWDRNAGDTFYHHHELLALDLDARIVLGGVGLLAIRIEGSVAMSLGVGQWVCFDAFGGCEPGRFEERIGADLGGGGRIPLVRGADARLSLDVTGGVALAWVSTSTDQRGSYRTTAYAAGDRGAVGAFLELRGVLELAPELSFHAGVRVRTLLASTRTSDVDLDVVAEGLVGVSWILPM